MRGGGWSHSIGRRFAAASAALRRLTSRRAGPGPIRTGAGVPAGRPPRQVFDPARLTSYRENRLAALSARGSPGWREISEGLLQEAERAIARGLYAVIDKTALPPSGDPHDYFHPAPYWWPNPTTADGRPYVYRDGVRAPGTEIHGAGSDRYDRSRLQRLFEDTTLAALAWRIGGDGRFAAHGARLVRRWFLSPDSRMNPHLRYAQVIPGRGGEGSPSGIIEMKDLYFFLDAARLLERAGALAGAELEGFRGWLATYAAWLRNGAAGRAACRAANNHSTYYDLQLAAIAAYLGEAALLADIFRRSSERMRRQFRSDGAQPQELRRTRSAHYCCFNLQGWVNLAELAERCGEDLWHYRPARGAGLRQALEWLLAAAAEETWSCRAIDPIDRDRLLPLQAAYRARFAPAGAEDGGEAGPPRAILSPYDGIKPYWFL